MINSDKPFRIAVAGLGTVGLAVIKLLQQNRDLITARAGRPITIVAVSARDRGKDRGISLAAFEWYDNAAAMATESQVDLVVELIGGSEGLARQVVEASLSGGRGVVTANKALLATHGVALARLAESKGVPLACEAAVAGGIPIIKALREGMAGNKLSRVVGILNGTCNFILTKMRATGEEFAPILAEAQALGYAEAEPSFDIDGIDTAHKLALLAAFAFGIAPAMDRVSCEGIRDISPLDLQFAEELGYCIKLLGLAERVAAGVSLRVHPTMVPITSPLAHVEGVFNAVMVRGDAVGDSFYQGRGAGGNPTASAVVADLIDIARGHTVPLFNVAESQLQDLPIVDSEQHNGAYYIRLSVLDQPGAVAAIAGILSEQKVSLESVIQRGRNIDQAVPLVLTTHETNEASMMRALKEIAKLQAVLAKPQLIRIIQDL